MLVDFNNLNSSLTVPQPLTLQNNSTPQLTITPSSSGDVGMSLIGRRNNSTASQNARLLFRNYDSDDQPGGISTGGFTNTLFGIHGRVTDASNNWGGMVR